MKYVTQYYVFSLIPTIASLHGNISITHGCSCVSVKWFRTAFLLRVFFNQYYEVGHLSQVPIYMSGEHCQTLSPMSMLALSHSEPSSYFPQSLDLSLWWYPRRFRGILSHALLLVSENRCRRTEETVTALETCSFYTQTIGVFALWALYCFPSHNIRVCFCCSVITDNSP